MSKRIKFTSRIVACGLFTGVLMSYNYTHSCLPQHIGFVDCFYLRVEPYQIAHVLALNTLLFAVHIYEKCNQF